jgi:putative sensory transduction regulator
VQLTGGSGEGVGDPPATPEELAAYTALIDGWAVAEADGNPLVAHIEFVPDERRWLVRLRGEDKAVITVWLTLRQRTLHYETYFIPAPEENIARCWEYLLRLNARLYAMRFAIGDEDAVYLTGQLPLKALDTEELDRIIGASYAYTEQYFRSALAIAFESRLRTPPGAAP